MFELVKKALRISGDFFDDEIKMNIKACLGEMQALGVVRASAVNTGACDPQIVSAIVAYCKWQFGDNETADKWEKIYHEKLAQMKTMTNYTDWSANNGQK